MSKKLAALSLLHCAWSLFNFVNEKFRKESLTSFNFFWRQFWKQKSLIVQLPWLLTRIFYLSNGYMDLVYMYRWRFSIWFLLAKSTIIFATGKTSLSREHLRTLTFCEFYISYIYKNFIKILPPVCLPNLLTFECHFPTD